MINFIIYSFQLYIIEITFVLPLKDSDKIHFCVIFWSHTDVMINYILEFCFQLACIRFCIPFL